MTRQLKASIVLAEKGISVPRTLIRQWESNTYDLHRHLQLHVYPHTVHRIKRGKKKTMGGTCL